jgi:CubicO group peptidase (beta-lactamase class C family)
VTKPIVAAAVALAGAADRPVISLLPELHDRWTVSRALTMADLLSHTSGLLEESLTKPVLAALGSGPDALFEAAARVVSQRQVRTPGTEWQYYNGNYYLAGAALARLGDDTFEAVVERLVLGPAGMRSTTFDVPADATSGHLGGVAVAPREQPRARRPTAGLWSTVDDLLGFGEFLLADRDLLATVSRPRTPATSETQYALGWCVARDSIVHWGAATGLGFRSALQLVPGEHQVTALLANDESAGAAIDELLGSRGPW